MNYKKVFASTDVDKQNRLLRLLYHVSTVKPTLYFG